MQTAQLHDSSISQQRLEIVVPCMLHVPIVSTVGGTLCYFKLLSKIFIIKFLSFSLPQTILKCYQKKIIPKKRKLALDVENLIPYARSNLVTKRLSEN